MIFCVLFVLSSCWGWLEQGAGGYIVEECTAHGDILCTGCAADEWCDGIQAHACSKCDRPGEYTDRECEVDSDAGCAECPQDAWCSEGTMYFCGAGSSTRGAVGGGDAVACTCDAGYFRRPPSDDDDAEATGECIECPSGQWCAGLETEPQACSDANAVTYRSGASSADECKCMLGWYHDEDLSECTTCPPFAVCELGLRFDCVDPTHMFVAVSGDLGSCTCVAGYYHDGGAACVECPAGAYCEEGATSATACGEQMTSPALSTAALDCVCVAGTYEAGGECYACVKGEYCVGGREPPVACALEWQTTAGEGASSADDCVCENGMQLLDGGCAPCAAGLWCRNGGVFVCPNLGRTHAVGAASEAECELLCEPGEFWDAQTGCELCPMGMWCAGDDNAAVACGEWSHTLSVGAASPKDCVCMAGFWRAHADDLFCVECEEGNHRYISPL